MIEAIGLASEKNLGKVSSNLPTMKSPPLILEYYQGDKSRIPTIAFLFFGNFVRISL